MKNIRVFVGVAVVLSAGAVAVWMWPTSRMGLCHVHHDKDIYGKDEVVKQIQNRVLPARPPIPDYYPTEAESNELVRVFVEITDAYTNAPLLVLREKFAMMPDFITNVAETVYIGARRPLYAPFGQGFVFAQRIPDFDDVQEFTDFAERNVAMVRFLGDIEVKRGSGSGYLVRLERSVLRVFTHCREKFRNDGKAELEALSDRFVREWCEQIESEKSFTRSYARFQVALQMSGGKTRAQANRFARSQTWGEGSSYKPKWLDEEFPVVPTPQN